MNKIALAATLIIVARQIVSQLHGMAHEELGVGLAAWQWLFVYTVIVAGPLAALVLYWTRFAAAGAMLLGVTMLAGMLFGIYFHFIFVSPDNVGHLPAGHGQHFFIATAIALVPLELAGTVFGFWSWTKLQARRSL